MRKKTRTILEELQSLRHHDSDTMIENSASNILNSVMQLLERCETQYGVETSIKIEKKFINAVRSGDPDKFIRSFRQAVKESKNGNNS